LRFIGLSRGINIGTEKKSVQIKRRYRALYDETIRKN